MRLRLKHRPSVLRLPDAPARLASAGRPDDLFDDGEGVDFPPVRDIPAASRQDAELTSAYVLVDGELVGARGGSDGVEFHLIAVGAARGVKNAPGQDAKLAIVGVDAESKELVLINCDAGVRHINENLEGLLERELGLASIQMAVVIFFNDTVSRG